jgi:hypothetical protein
MIEAHLPVRRTLVARSGGEMSEHREAPEPNKYAKLPPPIRPEDMRTSQDVRPQPTEKGEHDRETEFMLRTTGLFI